MKTDGNYVHVSTSYRISSLLNFSQVSTVILVGIKTMMKIKKLLPRSNTKKVTALSNISRWNFRPFSHNLKFFLAFMELEGKITQSYFFKFSKIRIIFNPTKIFPWKFCKNFVHLEKFAKIWKLFSGGHGSDGWFGNGTTDGRWSWYRYDGRNGRRWWRSLKTCLNQIEPIHYTRISTTSLCICLWEKFYPMDFRIQYE